MKQHVEQTGVRVGMEALACLGSRRQGSLYVPVRVLAVRHRYGRQDVLVRPLNGAGQQWLEWGVHVTENSLANRSGEE